MTITRRPVTLFEGGPHRKNFFARVKLFTLLPCCMRMETEPESAEDMTSSDPLARRLAYGDPTAPIDQQASAPHTRAELETIMGLLSERRPRISAISVGHARDAASRAAANAIVRAWTDQKGDVLGVVDWPEEAASWLRQATRLVAGAPDVWVVAGSPLGWAQMGRRLLRSTDWDPERTIAFSSLADIRLIELAGPDVFKGLRGALPDGGTWRIGGGLLIRYPPPDVHHRPEVRTPAP